MRHTVGIGILVSQELLSGIAMETTPLHGPAVSVGASRVSTSVLRSAGAAALLLLATGAVSAQSLRSAIDCEATVQATYWQLRSDGKAGVFPLDRYRNVLVQRAERTAREVEYVRERRGRDIDARDLQLEIDRIERDTKSPEALKTLFAALGNDPQRIGECLAKPLLAERMSMDAFARDAQAQAGTRYRAETELARLRAGRVKLPAAGRVETVDLVPFDALMKALAASPDPSAGRSGVDPFANHALWPSLAKDQHAGSAIALLRAFRVGEWMVQPPVAHREAPLWSPLVETFGDFRALRGQYRNGKLELRVMRWPKQDFSTWWAASARRFAPDYTAKATPQLQLQAVTVAPIGEWQPMRRFDSYDFLRLASASDDGQVVISTGTEMLVWGGVVNYGDIPFDVDPDDYSTTTPTNFGAAYNPATDSWRSLSTVRAPSPRQGANAVWTGTKMLVQGGANDSNTGSEVFYRNGGLYDPVADSWTAVANAPNAWAVNSFGASVVWTGSKAIFFGGHSIVTNPFSASNTGAIFDPATGTWNSFAIASTQIGGAMPNRTEHAAVWTGSTMLVFGGAIRAGSCPESTDFAFNPLTGVGSKLTSRSTVAPDVMSAHAFWNGTTAVVYGGHSQYGCAVTPDRDAFTYTPATQAIKKINATGDPLPDLGSFTPVLVGSNSLVVWDGSVSGTNKNGGAIYNVSTDTWTPINNSGAPAARNNYLAVAVGSQMVAVAGNCASGTCGDGGRFDPAANAWHGMSMPVRNGPPPARTKPSFAGDATELFLWGGSSAADQNIVLGDGAMYDSVADSWHPIAAAGAPAARSAAFAAYTGNKFLLWGGNDVNVAPIGDGAQYDPVADAWTPIPAPPLALNREGQVNVWDGSGLVVWGGFDKSSSAYRGDGARFVAANGSWSSLPALNAPNASEFAVSASDGNGNTLVWRGMAYATGFPAIYHASTNSWSTVPKLYSIPSDPNSDAFNYEASWMGDRFGILKVGNTTSDFLYQLDDVATGSWSKASVTNGPTHGLGTAARKSAWTGRQLLVWGSSSQGLSNDHPGWLYRQSTNAWTYPPTLNAPRGQTSVSMARMGAYTAVYGGAIFIPGGTQEYYVSGSLYREDTRTGALAARLATAITMSPAQPAVGDTITFIVKAINNGPNAATGVNVSFNLQTNLVFSSLSKPASADCTHPAANSAGIVHCSFYTINPNTYQTMTVKALASGSGSATAVSTIAGSGVESDPNTANNTATQQFTVQ